MKLAKLARVVGLMVFGAVAFAPHAWSVEAAATSAVNVRSGPGVEFAIVDTLASGEVVDIVECNAANTWCRIFHEGPDGWVSRSYLGAPSHGGTAGSPIQFGLTIPLPGGGSITFATPGYTPPEGGGVPSGGDDPEPVVETARVCFYDLPDFAGASVCAAPGASDASVAAAWNDRVSSLKVSGGASVRLCRNINYGGLCNIFRDDISVLGAGLNNQASSFDIMPPEPSRVCAYDLPNFQGESVCLALGASDDSIGAAWNNRVTSLKVFGAAEIRLCQNPGFGGLCNTFDRNVAMLGGPLNDNASSFRVSRAGTASISDARLKTDIVRLAALDHGIGLYAYRLIGESNRRIGVMAQEVIQSAPQAVVRDRRGYYLVDYGILFSDPALQKALQDTGYRLSP